MDIGMNMDLKGRQGQDTVQRRRRSQLAACLIFSLVIFAIDSFTALGSAVAVLYVIVIVMAAELGGRRTIKAASLLCAMATVTSFAIVHGLHSEAQAVLRLIFSLAANAVTLVLLLRRDTEIENRRAAEASLSASETRYRTIFNTLAVAIWEHDFTEVKGELQMLRRQGVTDLQSYLDEHPEFVTKARKLARITDVNETALTLLGVPTKGAFFSHLDEFLWEQDLSFAQCLIAIDAGQTHFQAETKLRDRHGKLIPVIVALNFPNHGEGLNRIQGSIVDITERLAMQEAIETSRRELEHASRAAMIGEISASIAHEVNQPLTATMNYLQAAQRWINRPEPDLSETRRAVEQALVATEHSANVVRRVRMLLGKAKSDTSEVAVETAILDALHLKRAELLAHGSKPSLDLSREDPIIVGDRILLQQVFLNLITNAMQAMDAVAPDERALIIRSRQEPGKVLISIADHGPGLAGRSGEMLFKAFNTTKADGMGLGLAMCRSIVSAHGGTISIADRVGARGAIVDIMLPLPVLDAQTQG